MTQALDAEVNRIAQPCSDQFSCSLLMARRVLALAPNHNLATLVNYSNIRSRDGFHRALYDAEMTAKVWLTMLGALNERYALYRFLWHKSSIKHPKNQSINFH